MTRILLIEDDPDVRTTLEISFRLAGFEVDEAGNGDEGLAMIRSRDYDLVVTDLWMPEVDGIGVIREAAKLRPGLKVIVISGGSPGRAPIDFSVALAEAHGADAVFHKPFNNDELISAVRSVLGTGGTETVSGDAAGPAIEPPSRPVER